MQEVCPRYTVLSCENIFPLGRYDNYPKLFISAKSTGDGVTGTQLQIKRGQIIKFQLARQDVAHTSPYWIFQQKVKSSKNTKDQIYGIGYLITKFTSLSQKDEEVTESSYVSNLEIPLRYFVPMWEGLDDDSISLNEIDDINNKEINFEKLREKLMEAFGEENVDINFEFEDEI